MDTDVIIAGGGPVGLMLAAELRLGGVRALVLERHPELGHTHNANGLGGQIVELLRYRGLLSRFTAVAADPSPVIPAFPFGGIHVPLDHVEDPPLKGLRLQHPSVDRLLDERAVELGAEVRRGHRVVGLEQDDEAVTAVVEGPDGPSRVTARFLVGCDGARSRVRELAGIAFPGVTHPDVNRLAEVAVADGVAVHEDGALEVPGVGRVPAGFTRTAHGVLAFGSTVPGTLMVHTIEDEATGADHDGPLTTEELRESIRRVVGFDLPLGAPTRLARYRHEARQADRYRAGRTFLAGDAAHVLPATGIARSVGMLDAVNLAWKLAAAVRGTASPGLLDSYGRERHAAGARALLQTQAQVALRRSHDGAADALREVFAELLRDEAPARRLAALVSGADTRYPDPHGGPDDDRHLLGGRFAPDLVLRTPGGPSSVAELLRTARPVLLDLAGREDLRDVAAAWRGRVDVCTAEAVDRPADALLIRPDAHVAWAADVGAPARTSAPALRRALEDWFGAP